MSVKVLSSGEKFEVNATPETKVCSFLKKIRKKVLKPPHNKEDYVMEVGESGKVVKSRELENVKKISLRKHEQEKDVNSFHLETPLITIFNENFVRNSNREIGFTVDLENDYFVRVRNLFDNSVVKFCLKRCQRVQENCKEIPISPIDYGMLKIYRISDFRKRTPLKWGNIKHAFFVPMYENESFYVEMQSRKESPFAVEVKINGKNIIKNDPCGAKNSENLRKFNNIQNYFVTDNQQYIDGFSTNKGKVGQFNITNIESKIESDKYKGMKFKIFPLSLKQQNGKEKNFSFSKGRDGKDEIIEVLKTPKELGVKDVIYLRSKYFKKRKNTLEDEGIDENFEISVKLKKFVVFFKPKKSKSEKERKRKIFTKFFDPTKKIKALFMKIEKKIVKNEEGNLKVKFYHEKVEIVKKKESLLELGIKDLSIIKYEVVGNFAKDNVGLNDSYRSCGQTDESDDEFTDEEMDDILGDVRNIIEYDKKPLPRIIPPDKRGKQLSIKVGSLFKESVEKDKRKTCEWNQFVCGEFNMFVVNEKMFKFITEKDVPHKRINF